MPAVSYDTAERGIDPEQHLELVLRRFELQAVDDSRSFPHESLVVRGNRHVAAGAKELVHEENIVGTDNLSIQIRHGPRLDIDALDYPDVGLAFDEPANIIETPSQAGLDDDSYVVELAAQPFIGLDGVGSTAGVLHVEADEVRALPGESEEVLDVLVTELPVQLESHMAQLDVDIGVEIPFLDGGKNLLVLAYGCLGFLAPGNELSEDADCAHHPSGVYGAHRSRHIIQSHATEVRPRKTSDQTLRDDG
jgi:hypothetical protein